MALEYVNLIPPAPPSQTIGQKHANYLVTVCYKHCRNCVLLTCQETGCRVMNCPLLCGARMHHCKIDDHVANVCPYFKVQCINSAYGCPQKMERRRLGPHLLVCPASVIRCTAEWNRMPRLLGEKRPFLLPPSCSCCKGYSVFKPRSTYTQNNSSELCLLAFHKQKFDLALTARDQAILEAGTRVSDKTKGALRSNITKLYPALPMTSSLYPLKTCSQCSAKDGSQFAPLSYPHTFIPVTPSGAPIFYEYNRQDRINLDSEFSDSDTFDDQNCCSNEAGDALNPGDPSANKMSPDDPRCLTASAAVDVEFDQKSPRPTSLSVGGDSSSTTTTTSQSPTSPLPRTSAVADSTTPTMRLSSSSPLSEKMSWAISDRSLQVDCQVEFFPRYVHKPMAMYTFLCDHDIPRRDFECHTRLHCDILGQVDYWLEQRCPLAYLGCPFSVVRLHPNRPDASLVYMPANNVFSVRYANARGGRDVGDSLSTSDPCCDARVESSFLDLLSWELIQRIAGMLDEVSLMNLSRVSPRYAAICHSLLFRRGIVTPIWERLTCSPTGLTSWRITAFLWKLPVCGEPIRAWSLNSTPQTPSSDAKDSPSITAQISRHLADGCAFYEVLCAKKPFCLHKPEELPFS